MAVKFIENTGQGVIGFWEITESVGQLMELLDPDAEELENFHLYRNELRKKEWLAVRLLLRQMNGQDSKIGYDPSGKPLLVNKPGHISISHSSNCAVICFHPEWHPGIDIESVTRHVERAARKFLSEKELKDCTRGDQLSNKDLLLRWCAKEAIFKMVPFSDIDFASQITCIAQPVNSENGMLQATFTAENTRLDIPLNYRIIDEILMVWGTLRS
jgi:phosphopantetheinyl transferase